jgi:quercetin dioxygenase-like cupin family protein
MFELKAAGVAHAQSGGEGAGSSCEERNGPMNDEQAMYGFESLGACGLPSASIMLRTRSSVWRAFVLLLPLCGVACAPTGTNEPAISVSTEMSVPLTDIPGKEGTMIVVEYGPGAADPVHRHNAHGFLYVLEGSVVMQVKGGKEVTLTRGQSFYEGPQDVHVVGRNASNTESARFVVFLVKDKGTPILIPEP